MNGITAKQAKAFETLKGPLGLTNVMQTPKLVKVVVSAGIGSLKDKKKIALVEDRLVKIVGQKLVTKGAKKSVANFKTRQGDPVGLQVTLRGARMVGFLDKLLDVVLPRTHDFRGISKRAVDAVGNITLGIREHTVFPETADEELKDVFGLAVTIVTTAKNAKDATAYFEYLGIPFSKIDLEKVSRDEAAATKKRAKEAKEAKAEKK